MAAAVACVILSANEDDLSSARLDCDDDCRPSADCVGSHDGRSEYSRLPTPRSTHSILLTISQSFILAHHNS